MVHVLAVKPGDVLAAKYRVEKVLGVGGMGAVVSARHVELGTKVALKFLLPQLLESPAAVARFQREARAAVRLKGPHTAKITDVGKLESGSPYLVMEYLTGRDLGQVVAEDGPLPVQAAVAYTLHACESLAEAHGLGIVHRDLKPQNLFLTRAVDGTALVKVLDFGLARIEGDTTEQRLTQTTDVMGSPAYMSPEQLRGAREAGAKSDLWSLGVCLFELLTGRLPFESRTVPELCAMILMQPPMPVRALRSEVPPGVEAAILRCLEKDPAARLPTVVELAGALEPYGGPAAVGATRRIGSTFEAAARGALADEPAAGMVTVPDVLDTSKSAVFATSETAIDVRVDTRTAFDSGARRDAPRYGKAAWIGVSVALSIAGLAYGAFHWGHRPARDEESALPVAAAAPPVAAAAGAAVPTAAPTPAPQAAPATNAADPAGGPDAGGAVGPTPPLRTAAAAPPATFTPAAATPRPPSAAPHPPAAPHPAAKPVPASPASNGNGRDHI